MEFNFVDKSKVTVTKFSYSEFDTIINRFGYKIEKNGFLHNYFEWGNIEHFTFDYQKFNDKQLYNLFSTSIVYRESVTFLIRLQSYQPLIQISSVNIALMFDDLCRETGMGWEAISLDGKYILEFTDNYEHMAKSNFEIMPSSFVNDKD